MIHYFSLTRNTLQIAQSKFIIIFQNVISHYESPAQLPKKLGWHNEPDVNQNDNNNNNNS